MNGVIAIHLSIEPEEIEQLLGSHVLPHLEASLETPEEKCMGVIIHLISALLNCPPLFDQVDAHTALALQPPGPITRVRAKHIPLPRRGPRDSETGREQP